MKKERMIILLGTLVALIFFYIGLDQWLKQKPTSEPPPITIRPTTPPKPTEESQPKVEGKAQTPASTQMEQRPELEKKREDLIAKKIEEEKKVVGFEQKDAKKAEPEKKPEPVPAEPKNKLTAQKGQFEKEIKEYVIQIGAFSSKENAENALSKAIKMGYTGEIIREDKFYKVRIKVKTDDLKGETNKLRSTFGGAIVKK